MSAFEHWRGPDKLEYGKSANSAVIVKGGVLVYASGYLQHATTASTNLAGVAAESLTGDGTTLVSFYPAIPENKFKAATTGTPTQAQVGTTCALETATTIDEDETGVTVFLIEEVYNATDKEVIGSFSNTVFIT